MNTSILEARELSFSYKNKQILKNISFKLGNSEIFSIIGPNGAGKTTLLNCLLNLAKPSGGNIFLKGKSVYDYDRRKFCSIVSFVPQAHKPVFDYSVEEIVLMGKNPCLPMFSRPSSKDREDVLKTLDELKISHLKGRCYTQISGGELRLVLIARAVVSASQLIFLDEPAAHLDIKNQLDILELLKKLSLERKVSIVMVVHDPGHALTYSDSVMLLKDGENIAYGKPGETITPENIFSAYGVKTKIADFEGKKVVVMCKI